MKLFISWSGDRSKIVAEALRDWIPLVFQAVEPWVSTHDIDAGTSWSSELQAQLKEIQFGIICLTPENLSSTWVHFESGALAKTVIGTHVCPYLIHLKKTDIKGPLSHFQGTLADSEGTWYLTRTINKALQENGLSESQLQRTFDKWWPDLERKISEVPITLGSKEVSRPVDDMTREILEIVRELRRDSDSINNILTLMKIRKRQRPLFTNRPPLPGEFAHGANTYDSQSLIELLLRMALNKTEDTAILDGKNFKLSECE